MATVEDNIIHSLNRNGFPEKKVSLPFQPLYKACKKEETKLSDVLNKLEAKGIFNSMHGDKIIFYSEDHQSEEKSNGWEQYDFSDDMVQEAMKKMSEFDPAELERIKQQVANLTPEQKSELLKNAKDMFKKNKP